MIIDSETGKEIKLVINNRESDYMVEYGVSESNIQYDNDGNPYILLPRGIAN